MMSREQVFGLINNERDFQDTDFNPECVLSSGQTRKQRDLEVSPGVLMLSAYVDRAKQKWITSKGTNLSTLQEVAKIAAIAIRVLERAGGSEELLTKGLR